MVNYLSLKHEIKARFAFTHNLYNLSSPYFSPGAEVEAAKAKAAAEGEVDVARASIG